MEHGNNLLPILGYGAVCTRCGAKDEICPTAGNGPINKAEALNYFHNDGWTWTESRSWHCPNCSDPEASSLTPAAALGLVRQMGSYQGDCMIATYDSTTPNNEPPLDTFGRYSGYFHVYKLDDQVVLLRVSDRRPIVWRGSEPPF